MYKVEKYLDITKNVIISSPAGAGKTEKLSRRYVSLLTGGSPIERILAVTFTEKAAAEMKERILRILEQEVPDLFMKVREKMPLMRISTIHAFCLKLLKRFSIELGLDPSLEVMDEFNADTLWSESVYESLMDEKDNPDLFFDMIIARGVKGWNSLFRTLNELHTKRPHPEIMIREKHWCNGEGRKILELYARCLKRYNEKKTERHLIDFNDIEILTYEALLKNPQWHNILYSFDEHTDHLLVDEFQDTSSLQWKIIDKLTEEWRSGIGAKRDSGKIPSVFLVGDEKQSIYLFRGANVSVFQDAKQRFSEWFGEDYYYEDIRENYRSLPAIVNFINGLFERLMSPSLYDTWRTRYTPFEAIREGDGHVELILLGGCDSTRKNREHEAAFLAKRIQTLHNQYEIWDGDDRRKCSYGDMAILMRKRTHLTVLEDIMRKNGIPFIVVKGIGFYDEPEVALLREFISFIVDPSDDYSLFCLLRSPLFGIDYKTLFSILGREDGTLLEKIISSKKKKLREVSTLITGWIERSTATPLAVLIEEALSETEGWKYFWEKQRHVNIKKFIGLIEQYESQGFSGIEIREILISARFSEESKANINTEGMNAVKIMTVHAAKGLQFPIVFIPSLDEDNAPRSSSIVLEEDGGRIHLAYEEDSLKRKKIDHFQRRREKELEEEKRLFYVAVTRARDFLCMLGAPKKDHEHSGRLAYILENIHNLPSLKLMREPDIEQLFTGSSQSPTISHDSPPLFFSEPIYTEPLSYEPPVTWRNVTEDLDIRIKHGEDWVLLGRVFHSLFEELSKGILKLERLKERASDLLRNTVLNQGDLGRLLDIIKGDFRKLDLSGHLGEIILPHDHAFTELPFVLRKGDTVFKGRIDRVIIRDKAAFLYDYKTFPAQERELTELIGTYRFQMDIYKTAAEKLFSLNSRGFLLFTHLPLLAEV